MSEQTPNSSEDLSGAEPSMEDILASIRKIISEDEPVAMESPENLPVASLVEDSAVFDIADLTSDAVLDAEDLDLSQAAEGESVDIDIDDVLARLDADMAELETPDVVTSTAASPMADLAPADLADVELDDIGLHTDDDILSLLDDDISLTEDTPSADEASFSLDDDEEMNALLEDILMAPDEPVSEFSDEAPIADQQIESVRVESGEDLDLVKSLMADLADDPDAVHISENLADEDLDALLAIPEIEEPSVEIEQNVQDAVSIEAEMDAPELAAEEDILGDILNMTLEDQLQAQPDDIDVPMALTSDDVAAFEVTNVAENTDVEMDDILAQIGVPDAALDVETSPSLSDIAAAAEADAIAAETASLSPIAAAAGVAAVGTGLAALDLKAFDDTPQEEAVDASHIETISEAVVEPAPEPTSEPTVETPTQTQTIPSQETPMPVHAVNTDAILDEVTETAAAGAFAQLNTVVEDKAIFNERGPRIGDLVQEALRPMLKDWLDANLKGIVERAVTKEVKRISSGK